MLHSIPHRILDDASLVHGFFTRQGGVSKGLYESLNCGAGSRDVAEHVQTNKDRVAHAMQAERLVTLAQVHGTHVMDADVEQASLVEADAMVCTTPGVALGILTADCAPVLFADTQAGVVGAAHAGWKGARSGVLEATVQAMCVKGARLSRIKSVVGPCIHQESYAVGDEFYADFLAHDADNEDYFTQLHSPQGEQWHFDLQGYILSRLLNIGVARVGAVEYDTCQRADWFFSNRRRHLRSEPDYGRQISVIMLRK